MSNYLVLGELGTAEGPCSEHCSHLVCIQKRHDAESACVLCDQPIGLGVEIYLTVDGFAGSYVHRLCFEIRIAEIRAKLQKGINHRTDQPFADDEGRQAASLTARQLRAWGEGNLTNEELNALRVIKPIHNTGLKLRTISRFEQIEEARKSAGVRKRGRHGSKVRPIFVGPDTATEAEPEAE